MLIQDANGELAFLRRLPPSADAASRAAALELVAGRRLPGLTFVAGVDREAKVIEVREEWVDGVNVGRVLPVAQEHVSVAVALTLISDVASGLAALHAVTEPDGRPAKLIHGQVRIEHLLVDAEGAATLGGLTGERGDPAEDAAGLLGLLRALLARRATTVEGEALLARLGQLRFKTCAELARAVEVYLARQDVEELRARRVRFAALLREAAGPPTPPSFFDDPSGELLEPTAGDHLESPFAEDIWGQALGELDELPPPLPREPSSPFSMDSVGGALVEDPGSAELPTFDGDETTGDGATILDAAPLQIPPDEDTMETRAAELEGLEPGAEGAAREALLTPAAAPEERPKGVIIGDYRVVASVGRGGMGEIYLARSWKGGVPGRLVALKVLSGTSLEGEDYEEALAMLMDEAAIMARIDHPNVLDVADFGQAEGRYFLASEYLEGRPLVRVMIEAYAKEEGLDYPVIAAIGADAALGLHAAHTATTPQGVPLRVVHRDVSPQNIFVTYAGVSKVIDFGVARAVERISRTQVGLVKGKAAYMSPEQAEGRTVDARSDVFSLGICLWEMTAGRRLFKRDLEYDTLMAVQTAPIEPPTVARGQPNPVLDHIILGALHRDPAKRTASAQKLAAQLIDFATVHGVKDRSAVVGGLLGRIFGEVAAKERSLIASLEARIATPEEAALLGSLSGVAAPGGIREITLVGAPASLSELDDFGVRAPTVAAETDVSTGEHVIRQVSMLRAERQQSVLAPVPDDGGFDREPTPILGPGTVLPRSASMSDEGFAPISSQLPASSPAAAPVAPQSGSRGPLRMRVRLGVFIVFALFLVVGTAVVVAWMARSGQREGPVIQLRQGDEADPVPAEPPGPERSPEPPVQPVRGAPPIEGAPPLERPVSPAPPTVRPSSVEELLEALKERGLGASVSQGTYMVDDGRGGAVLFPETARVTAMGDEAAAFVVESESDTLASVAWFGPGEDGAWRARPISVNDCPAKVRVDGAGTGLRYGGEEIMLPAGGGVLRDVSLEPPEGARRLEVEPLGLAVGDQDPRSGAVQCKTGWWGKRVVLRRLPMGRYTLRWIGDGVSQTATLLVSADEVKGGRWVKTSTAAR